jgi:hypothetical protein
MRSPYCRYETYAATRSSVVCAYVLNCGRSNGPFCSELRGTLQFQQKGAEIHVKDNEGHTVFDMAVELKSLGAWKRALEEGGFTEDGSGCKKPYSSRPQYFIT